MGPPSTRGLRRLVVPRLALLPLLALLLLLGIAACESRPDPDPRPLPPPLPLPPPPAATPPDVPAAQHITICSFNIQFLGQFRSRENGMLADLLAGYDVVVVQELVAPPYPGTFPDGTPYTPDGEAAKFFDEMKSRGFEHALSEEDTGTGDRIHLNSSATEWWVTFYKPSRVKPAGGTIPRGFLTQDRSNHPDYERVPYAFAFRSVPPLRETVDFVLISVHLQPDSGPAARARRKHELASIAAWISAREAESLERDYIVLGDMNIENAAELADATPAPFMSLNDECRPTNSQKTKPYDHVMFRPGPTREIDRGFDMVVVDLVAETKSRWQAAGRTEIFPGDPYEHDAFRQRFSDHMPIVFRIAVPQSGDDD
jgi:endonuclease/exonuclease/phosphatase family metal-dependent hydrolase